MDNSINLIGQRFGSWTIIAAYPRQHRQRRRWLCRCDCGTERAVERTNLQAGKTKSCGCSTRTMGGKWGTPEYRTWRNMLMRCYNQFHNRYHRYGGRGVWVCKRWRESLDAFVSDMGPRPSGYSLERIDNNGNYEPRNCKWATAKEQARNKTSNTAIRYQGRVYTRAELAETFGVDYYLIRDRMKRGWTLKDAIETPRLRKVWNSSKSPKAKSGRPPS